MATSGTYTWNPSLSDVSNEAYDRVGIRASALTADHMISAYRSLNFMQSKWSNRGINLWTVDEQSVSLLQGVETYSVPTDTVTVIPGTVYIRTYAMGQPTSVTPAFATTIGSDVITVTLASSGVQVGEYCNVILPVAIGGIVLLGFYQVTSVLSTNTFTFTAADVATATASGGAVPAFTTTAQSQAVSVNLAAHGLLAGQNFTVQVQTSVGGITLSGVYPIASVTDANNFIITNTYVAGFAQTVSENTGLAQISVQVQNSAPQDRMMTAMSMQEYSQIPNKGNQGVPNSYWFDRLINPQITLWLVPDQNGPYELRYKRGRQIQDSNPKNGMQAEIPYRFQEAYVSDLAAMLAIKYAPDKAMALKGYADEMWLSASEEDRERVVLSLAPELGSYYRS